MRWTRMEDKEVEEFWTTFKSMYGPRVATFVYFLTYGNDGTHMVYEGDIYKRADESKDPTKKVIKIDCEHTWKEVGKVVGTGEPILQCMSCGEYMHEETSRADL